MMQLLGSISRISHRHCLLTVSIVLLITLFFGSQMRHMTVNNEITAFVRRDTPTMQAYELLNQEYGGTDVEFVLFSAMDVTAPEVIMEVDRVSRGVQQLDFVAQPPQSVAGLVASFIGRDSMDDPSAIAASLDHVKANSPQWNTFVSADDKYTLLMLKVEPETEAGEVRQSLEQAIGDSSLFWSTAVPTGQSVLMSELTDAATDDMQLLIPISVAAVVIILLLSFRRRRDVVYSLLVALLALLWVFGVTVSLGMVFTSMTMAPSLLVIGLGITYAIHLVNRYREEGIRLEPEAALIRASGTTGKAVFFSMLTSALAFSSFLIGTIPPIQQLGVVLCLGVVFSFVLTITLLPALYGFGRDTSEHRDRQTLLGAPALLRKAVLAAWRHKRWMALVVVVTLIASAVAVPYLELEQRIVHKIDSPASQAENVIAERFGIGTMITVVVHGSPVDQLDALRSLTSDLKAVDDVTSVRSVIDVIDAHPGLDPDEVLELAEARAWATTADTKIDIAYAGSQQERLVASTKEVIEDLQLDATVTGMAVFEEDMRGQLQSSYRNLTAMAATLILVVLYLSFRRPGLVIISFSPMLLVLLWQFGSMVALGIPLSMVTVTCSAMIIGIGVDFSIHVTERMREEYGHGHASSEAIGSVAQNTGAGMLSAALTIFFAFLVLGLSRLEVIHEFALISALVALYSFLAAMFIVPVVIDWWQGRQA